MLDALVSVSVNHQHPVPLRRDVDAKLDAVEDARVVGRATDALVRRLWLCSRRGGGCRVIREDNDGRAQAQQHAAIACPRSGVHAPPPKDMC